jgi:hypothetical protein
MACAYSSRVMDVTFFFWDGAAPDMSIDEPGDLSACFRASTVFCTARVPGAGYFLLMHRPQMS